MKPDYKTLLIFLLLIGCDNIKEPTPIQKPVSGLNNEEEIIDKIEKTNQLLNKAVLDGDYETQLKYFTQNAIIDPPLDPEIKGKNNLRASFEKNKKENVIFHSFSGTIKNYWVCGNKVYETGQWSLLVSSDKLKKPYAFVGSYFQIWEKQQDDTYLISYNIFTYDFNPFDVYKF
ncbi:MAG: hypothetical protein V1773_19360 [bacterium]